VSDCIRTGHQSCHRFEAYSTKRLVPSVDELNVQFETDPALQVLGMLQVSAEADSTRCPAGSFVVFEHLIVQGLVTPIVGRETYTACLLHP